jgi:hypothetical protein
MKYTVLVYVAPESLRGLAPEDRRSLHGEHQPPPGSVSLIVHYRFRPPRTATTIRVNGDEVVKTEGPSTISSERLRALYVVESDEQDAALEFAGQHPAVRLGGTAEVWPLIEAGQHDQEPPGHRGWRRRH